jgi:2-methylcitrate dehydratase PrpD
VAAALVEREISIKTFLPNSTRDFHIWKLLECTQAEIDPEIQRRFGHLPEGPGRVTIRTRGGAEYSHLVEYELGHPKNPMIWKDVTTKFSQCVRAASLRGSEVTTEIVTVVRHLEHVEDLRNLWGLLDELRSVG